MADFFHMGIEEADIPASIRAASERIVHVADSNRQQPGRGHLDFRPGFRCAQGVSAAGAASGGAGGCAASGGKEYERVSVLVTPERSGTP